jgi:peptidoglycan/LPS O-acetylase OafA/YrhL
VKAERFSIVNFYERRIRRIIPALFGMLAATSVLAYRFMMPSELEAYARSMLAAAFSFSNVLFWTQAGYFDGPSELKPLLHTWSLGVEEQFYVIFPLLLLVGFRWFPTKLRLAIWSFAALTFLCACFWIRRDASAVFFLLPFRAWELLMGTIVSQKYLPTIGSRIGRGLAGVVGLLLIFIPAFLYTSQTPFPGFAALPPCLGAALVISAGESGRSLASRLLSLKPIAFIGLISYSLYLWHWPVLVFQNSYALFTSRSSSDREVKIAIFAVSMLAAILSWWLIETPFRNGRLRPGRIALFAIAGTAFVAVSLWGTWVIRAKGIPARWPDGILRVVPYEHYDSSTGWRTGTCFLEKWNTVKDFRYDLCLKATSSRKQYLLYGDSLAAHLFPGLSTVFPGIEIHQASAAACPPLMAPSPIPSYLSAQFSVNCRSLEHLIYDQYLVDRPVKAIILAGFWQQSDLPELGRDIAWIQAKGIKVILVGPVMRFDLPLPHLLITSIQVRDPGLVTRHAVREEAILDRQMASLARDEWRVQYISFFENMCHSLPQTDETCVVYAAPGVPLFFDEHHFTDSGSKLFAETMKTHGELP